LQAAKPKPATPLVYRNALERLKQGDYAAALSWFASVRQQLPGTSSSIKAGMHRSLIYSAKELANLSLAKDYLAGKKLSLADADKGGASADFDALYNQHLKASQQAAKGLRAEVEELLGEDDLRLLNFDFSVPVKNLQVERLREQLRKGELLEEDKRKQLLDGLFLGNYLNLVSRVLNIPEQRILIAPYQGKLNRRKLYLIAGSRLSIIASAKQTAGQAIEFDNMALKCLNRVIDLSPRGKFDPDRLRAEELKKTVLKRHKKRKKLLDPRCRKKLKPGWKYCPYDGLPLIDVGDQL